MADKNTTQAKHITELSVGISGVQEQLQKVRDDIEATAKFAQENPIDLIGGSTSATKGGGVSGFTATKNSIESLNLSYKTFLNTLSKSKLDDSVIGSLKTRAKYAAAEVVDLGNAVSHSGKITKENSQAYQDLSSKLKTMKGELKDAETKAIETGEGFKQLGEGAKAAGTGFGDFINKLSDKFKWLMAYQFIIMIQNAFSQVISTIKGTEDAVIELQRVLNDSSLSNSAISDALYDIAYRYGQTFENVQETAVLFAQTGMDFNEVLQATEATMLGLNTAELEVTTATQGLIAVMSQFNLDASELNEIIDKINITADNFPVTSEKIVAALQRAGSAAYNYGLTLEETISIITALSEATGRAGANLGTALNSLINFSMKESSLKAFSDYLGGISLAGLDVLDVWTLLGNSIKDGGEELGKLMAESEEFADLFSEEMAEAVGAMDEYTAAVGNAEGVYQTAGVYRKNYFIALLNNIEAVTEALQNMNDATGYSIEENEKYMGTLTASWNQLVVVAQELAVQFGEIGWLNIFKILTDIAAQALKVSKNFGGLNTLLVATIALFAAAKREKLESYFSKISSAVQFAQGVFRLFNDVLATTNSVATATSVSLNVLFASNPVGWIAAGISAFVGIAGAMENARIKSEEYRQELIQLGKEAKSQTENVSSAYAKFLEETKDVIDEDDIKEASLSVFEALGYSENDANILIERYGGVNETLKILLDNMNKLNKQAAEDALDASEINVQDKMKEALNEVGRAFYSTEEAADEFIKTIWDTTKYENQYVGFLDQMKKKQAELEAQFTSEELKNNNVYQALLKYIPELEKELIQFNLDSDTVKLYGDTFADTAENVDKLKKSVKNLLDEDLDLSELADFENSEANIEKFTTAIEKAKDKIDDFRSSFSTLVDVVDEYNSTGIMTAEMLENLLDLDYDYIKLINLKNGAIELNTEGTNDMINANKSYMQQLVAVKIAEEALSYAQTVATAIAEGKTVAQINTATATSLLNSELFKLILQEMNGAATSEEVAQAIANIGTAAGISSEYLGVFAAGFKEIYENYTKLLSEMSASTLGGTKSISNPEKTALEAQVKEWQKKKETIKDTYDEQVKKIKEAKQASDDYYDNEIEKLKEVQEQNDRINKQLDYYANRQKILTNIEQAQSRSGVEWRQKEVEYQQELADLDRDWRDTLAEWDVEDTISEFERLKEEAADAYDLQLEKIKEMYDTAVKTIDNTISELQEKISSLAATISQGIVDGITDGMGKLGDEINTNLDTSLVKTEEKVANTHKKLYNDVQEVYFGQLESDVDEATTTFVGKFGTAAIAMKELLIENIRLAARDSLTIWKENFTDNIKDSISFNMSKLKTGKKDMSYVGVTQEGTRTVESANVNVYIGNVSNPSDVDSTTRGVQKALNQALFH